MLIPLTFIVDGEAFVNHSWPHVPCIGDEIQFTSFRAKVTNVVWRHANGTDAAADIICEKVKERVVPFRKGTRRDQ